MMAKAKKTCEVLLNLLKDWESCVVDSEGLLGGQAVIWNPRSCDVRPYKTNAGIMLEGRVQGFVGTMRLLNIYAPYKEQRSYLENVDSSGVLSLPNVIIGVDMNFTLF